jgi:hypothetical protein
MTTLDPGARDVFTKGGTLSPLATAFLAMRPAPMSTWGLDVLVQEVMAAMTMLPSPIFIGRPLSSISNCRWAIGRQRLARTVSQPDSS